MQSEVNIMKSRRYEAKDEEDLLLKIDEDPDKIKGWEGPIDVHLRSVRYPPKTKRKKRAVNRRNKSSFL